MKSNQETLLIEDKYGANEIQHLLEARKVLPIQLLKSLFEKQETFIHDGIAQFVFIAEVHVRVALFSSVASASRFMLIPSNPSFDMICFPAFIIACRR